LEIVQAMGGKLRWEGESTLVVEASATHGTAVDASQCPDLVPAVAALAAVSEGTTRIFNAGRVRIKESDRLKAIATEINKLGGSIRELPEGLEIEGRSALRGGIVSGWNDHRIVMSLAAISSHCAEPLTIDGAEAVRKSYPHFFEDFRSLGGTAR
jgi:3-phosphoshikimate 1-carboxyvinyltransferase